MAVLATYVFLPVIGEFFIEWAKQHGLYDDPQSRVDRAVSGFFSYADVWWVQWLTIFGVGCVVGLWVDSLSRKVPSCNTAVTPLRVERNEMGERNAGPLSHLKTESSYETASFIKFKIDGNIASRSVGNFRSTAFTSPCEGKFFVFVFFESPIDSPVVRVYSTRPNLVWRDMGINDQCLLLEVAGDIGFTEIAIDTFPALKDFSVNGPMLGESYDVHWLPDLDGWLDNPEVRHAYRLQTLNQKHR